MPEPAIIMSGVITSFHTASAVITATVACIGPIIGKIIFQYVPCSRNYFLKPHNLFLQTVKLLLKQSVIAFCSCFLQKALHLNRRETTLFIKVYGHQAGHVIQVKFPVLAPLASLGAEQADFLIIAQSFSGKSQMPEHVFGMVDCRCLVTAPVIRCKKIPVPFPLPVNTL